MAIVLTSKNEQILVDDALFDAVSIFTWYVNKMGYACNDTSPRKTMHRFLFGFPKCGVDHINGNKLDNRMENLRLCNQSQNTANSSKRSTNKSGYKGVSWNKRYSKWESYITKDYKHIFIGYFDSLEDAALAYNRKAEEFFGSFAKLNNL